MSDLKPWKIQYFRSGGFVNRDYDMARIYIDLPIIEGKKLLNKLNTRPAIKDRLERMFDETYDAMRDFKGFRQWADNLSDENLEHIKQKAINSILDE